MVQIKKKLALPLGCDHVLLLMGLANIEDQPSWGKVETFHQPSNLNSKCLPEDIKIRYVPVSLDTQIPYLLLWRKRIIRERYGRWESEIRCRHFC